MRGELLAREHRFSTSGDTEAILHRHEEVGPECTHSPNGMFASRSGTSGSASFCYAGTGSESSPCTHFAGNELVFGSEIKALIASRRVADAFEPEALWHYLTFRYVPAPKTMWRGVYKLPPGPFLRYWPDTGRLEVERYWDRRFEERQKGADLAEDVRTFSHGGIAREVLLADDARLGIIFRREALEAWVRACTVRECGSKLWLLMVAEVWAATGCAAAARRRSG